MEKPLRNTSRFVRFHTFQVCALTTTIVFLAFFLLKRYANQLCSIQKPKLTHLKRRYMKKFLTAILSAVLCLITVFGSACADETQKGKVNVKYYVNGQQIVQSIMGGSETIGLVPEPAASALQANYLTQKGQALYRLDLQELYDSQDKAYPQAVLMVKKSVLGAHPELVSNLQTKITESASWIKQNVSTAVDAINDNGGTSLNKNSLNSQAIDGCKIYWESAEDSKTSVKNYINKMQKTAAERKKR